MSRPLSPCGGRNPLQTAERFAPPGVEICTPGGSQGPVHHRPLWWRPRTPGTLRKLTGLTTSLKYAARCVVCGRATSSGCLFEKYAVTSVCLCMAVQPVPQDGVQWDESIGKQSRSLLTRKVGSYTAFPKLQDHMQRDEAFRDRQTNTSKNINFPGCGKFRLLCNNLCRANVQCQLVVFTFFSAIKHALSTRSIMW